MKKWIPYGGDCLVSNSLLTGEAKLLWAWREKPLNPQDSGWRFLSNHDTSTTLLDESTQLIDINHVAAIEPIVAGIYWYPVGADFQFSDHNQKKHFVYNADFKKVKLISSVAQLPVNSEAFQQHFPEYKKDDEQIGSDNLRFSSEELSQLSSSKHDLEQITDIFIGGRIDQPKDQELYIMVGLLMGYLARQAKALPISWQIQRKTLSGFLEHKFKSNKQTISNYIESYLALPGNGTQLSAVQLMGYGQVMYDLASNQAFEDIYQEYTKIVHHHQKIDK